MLFSCCKPQCRGRKNRNGRTFAFLITKTAIMTISDIIVSCPAKEAFAQLLRAMSWMWLPDAFATSRSAVLASLQAIFRRGRCIHLQHSSAGNKLIFEATCPIRNRFFDCMCITCQCIKRDRSTANGCSKHTLLSLIGRRSSRSENLPK